jgi:hypothetical protein
MRSVLIRAAWIGLAAFTVGHPLLAQLQDNTQKQLTCDNHSYDSDRARYCEMREQTVAAMGHLNVDAGRNGGVSVKGWLRNDVLVRARVEASADTESSANALAKQVSIASSGGEVSSSGPETADRSWWTVSYEIFVPQVTDLSLKAHNGGISISDVRGQIHFDAQNGGVQLRRLAGDVTGATVNGGIHVELAGTMWDGRQLDVSTRNGGVKIQMPSSYSAHIQAETVNGGMQSDFPVTVAGNIRPRHLDFNVGAGGPLIHVATTNGGVSLTQVQ